MNTTFRASDRGGENFHRTGLTVKTSSQIVSRRPMWISTWASTPAAPARAPLCSTTPVTWSASAEGGAANPVSHPQGVAVHALASTVVAALGTVRAADVTASLIGLAGVSCTGDTAHGRSASPTASGCASRRCWSATPSSPTPPAPPSPTAACSSPAPAPPLPGSRAGAADRGRRRARLAARRHRLGVLAGPRRGAGGAGRGRGPPRADRTADHGHRSAAARGTSCRASTSARRSSPRCTPHRRSRWPDWPRSWATRPRPATRWPAASSTPP